ncbi:hypothetical protein [Nocardia sp. NPDC004711]
MPDRTITTDTGATVTLTEPHGERDEGTDFEAAMSALGAVWTSRRQLQEQVAQFRRACKTLGGVVERQCRAALDATGLHDIIDETGDGDWQVVWERVAELGADLAKAHARIAELESSGRVYRTTLTRRRYMLTEHAATIGQLKRDLLVANARIAELVQQAALVKSLATEWATQPNDYDEDTEKYTEQQIFDGRKVLAILDGQPEVDHG